MSRIIAINGIKLHEVRMPVEPHTKGVSSYLTCPEKEIHFTVGNQGMTLVVPTDLAVELYRNGILPQQSDLPVLVQIDTRPEAWFVVSDVRYPSQNLGAFGRVTFNLTPVPQPQGERQQQAQPNGGTYVTDITHYLDDNGELMPLPGPARKLASFLTLLIDAATAASSDQVHDSGIRCRQKACRGSIQISLEADAAEILWQCPACGHHGVIRNWQGTKWNRLKHSEQRE